MNPTSPLPVTAEIPRNVEAPTNVEILMPVCDDWSACGALLRLLEPALASAGIEARVAIVDDGSRERPGADFAAGLGPALRDVRIIRLARNLGHQRAICVALAHLCEHSDSEWIVVMDSDGEDAPGDVPRLLTRAVQACGRSIVFAERSKRSESFLFRVGYQSYRLIHRILTGLGIRQGNFSVIPRGLLRGLCLVPELWSHYAAAVCASRIPFCHVPTQRAKRLAGQSSMNFVGLVKHGMSAISVYSDVVGVRLLAGASVLLVLVVSATIVMVLRLGSTASTATLAWMALASLALLQVALTGAALAIGALSDRKGAAFIPLRDAPLFIHSVAPAGRSAPAASAPGPA